MACDTKVPETIEWQQAGPDEGKEAVDKLSQTPAPTVEIIVTHLAP